MNVMKFLAMGLLTLGTCFAMAQTDSVVVYDEAPGQTGQWWCDNHFGANLGGSWRCDGVDYRGRRYSCGQTAPYNSVVTCSKWSNGGGGGHPGNPPDGGSYQTVYTTGGPVASRTGQWWCENHFGGNLGGYWQCVSTSRGSCHSGYLPQGTAVSCQRYR